mmetsp:Transcript_36878/g.51219  ORF Transcript_36878/g.51219 Transcript_36878/m.51219 type:complete len:81 (+) Transcript_36878:253-495(+)|eukprot:CAMPEP_0196583730 /NCGR_PEP_ID=MMETSP1081-20130531/44457_1 /TAXON_ID=36882 /ORGANISM="Pyramimonas amylifera, Strain CCMP720" /LENGTH=80 /DNA_ID=CAMNT_0041904695 /DNA_START=253 /DNA_END=495 /DNA_ORIENTATION=-
MENSSALVEDLESIAQKLAHEEGIELKRGSDLNIMGGENAHMVSELKAMSNSESDSENCIAQISGNDNLTTCRNSVKSES